MNMNIERLQRDIDRTDNGADSVALAKVPSGVH